MENEIKEILQSVQGIAPDVFEQVVRWGIISNLVGLMVAICVIVAAWIGVKVAWGKTEDGDEARGIAVVAGGGITLVALLVSIVATLTFLQAWLAPYAYFVAKMNN